MSTPAEHSTPLSFGEGLGVRLLGVRLLGVRLLLSSAHCIFSDAAALFQLLRWH
jgi:hypothetical protein